MWFLEPTCVLPLPGLATPPPTPGVAPRSCLEWIAEPGANWLLPCCAPALAAQGEEPLSGSLYAPRAGSAEQRNQQRRYSGAPAGSGAAAPGRGTRVSVVTLGPLRPNICLRLFCFHPPLVLLSSFQTHTCLGGSRCLQ